MKTEQLQINDILRVTKGDPAHGDAAWLETGDTVRVIELYPNIVRVERIRPNKYDGSHLTQSYGLKWWPMCLEKIKG